MAHPDDPAAHDVRPDASGDQDLVALARSYGLSDEAAQSIGAIDAVMARIRRNILKREFGRQIIARCGLDIDVSHMDAVLVMANRTGNEELTVGHIAERLGIDPSRASRVTSDIVEKGLARRIASQQDARRICLELTERGTRLSNAIRENKMALFASAMGQWSDEELVTFARLLERFSTWATDAAAIEKSVDRISARLAQSAERE